MSYPIIAFRGKVTPNWVDQNEHMTSMAYVSLFWDSLGPLFARLGITSNYISGRRLSIFQREAHLAWERELRQDAPVQVRSWLIAHDAKRIHHFHEIWHVTENHRAATMEYLSLHIDLAARRAAPFPEDIQANLTEMAAGFEKLPQPPGVGLSVSLARRKGQAVLSHGEQTISL